MKMIELLAKIANNEVEDGAIIKFVDRCDEVVHLSYDGAFDAFYDIHGDQLGDYYEISKPFLNLDIEYIPPKNILYTIKLNIRGLKNICVNLNKATNEIVLGSNFDNQQFQAHFTKAEMQNIQSLREFLEDVTGKYELIKVY